MKKPSFVNVLLTTTIVVLLFYIRTSADEPTPSQRLDLSPPTPQAACDYSRISGFAPAQSMAKGEVQELYNAYTGGATSRGETVYGGIISKAALDSIFCSGNFNALSYRLVKDVNGRKTQNGNNIFIVISGTNVDMRSGSPVISGSSAYFLPNLWCPPNCASF